MPISGTHYVRCRRCSAKRLNVNCSYREDIGWICFNHKEIQEFGSNAPRPAEGRRPDIIRRPSTQTNFGNVADLYWGTATQVWETVECEWEDV